MNRIRRTAAFVGHYDGPLTVALWTVWLAAVVTNELAYIPTGLAILAWIPAVAAVIACAGRHRTATCRRCAARRRPPDEVGQARAGRWQLLLALAVSHRWVLGMLLAWLAGVPVGISAGVATHNRTVGVVSGVYTTYMLFVGLNALHRSLMPWCRWCLRDRTPRWHIPPVPPTGEDPAPCPTHRRPRPHPRHR